MQEALADDDMHRDTLKQIPRYKSFIEGMLREAQAKAKEGNTLQPFCGQLYPWKNRLCAYIARCLLSGASSLQ